jgi:ABC-type sugar transport system ATPase subunit
MGVDMADIRLEMKNINKQFAGVKALDDAEFSLKAGEVHALLGINGAGKSTLIKILSGVYSKDSGDIIIEGKPAAINNPEDAIELGISTVFQDPQMIESFSGYENIYLGEENKSRFYLSGISRSTLRKKARELLAQYPLDIDIDKPVYQLSMIEREIIAVLRALSKKCNILILDEPTSILTEKEKQILFKCILELKSRGVSVIYITHHLGEVGEICDAYTVFRNGKTVAAESIDKNKVDVQRIAELMIGEKLSQLYPEKPKNINVAGTEFACENITLNGKLSEVSFASGRGEILGIFGLVGSGIDELSKILYGAMDCDAGSIALRGKKVNFADTKAALEAGVYLVPGNRKTEGQIGPLSIAENLSLGKLKKILNKIGLVDRKVENRLAGEIADNLKIAAPSVAKKVQELSGGNQQKVVIGKGLFSEAAVYIFCEPTVGVDVGAKSGIYETMRRLSEEAAVIIISSDPEEVFGNADRIIVINQGRVTLSCKDSETSLPAMLVKAASNQ